MHIFAVGFPGSVGTEMAFGQVMDGGRMSGKNALERDDGRRANVWKKHWKEIEPGKKTEISNHS